MWPFSRKPRLSTDEVQRLEALERRLKVIEADWDEWYDKFRRLYARLSKRVERGEAPVEEAPDSLHPLRSAAQRHQTTNPLAIAILRGNHGLLPDR
jgi:hypothetical protein